ncbi:MAG: hypothetical protein GY798_16905 [Hyphomicrobiales bacterium]|nr:hypothetical protein [Hyphomicrobiales bacterium]
MEMNAFGVLCLVASLVLGVGGRAYALEIAGLTPDRRPADAPEIVAVVKGPEWYRIALTGIEPPYPSSLRFLEDQGNWYTPFNRPGATGRYDIRGWYGSSDVGQ